MLQRLAQFCVALLEFLKQPNVLDGDDRLIGKGFKKRDLLISERTNFRAANHDRADGNAFSKQRHGKNRARPLICWRLAIQETQYRARRDVMNMNCFPVEHGSPRRSIESSRC